MPSYIYWLTTFVLRPLLSPPMRRSITLCLALAIAFSLVLQRHLGEMVKLPALVKHAFEHMSAGEDLMHFFAEHYGDHEHESGADDDHGGLPFHGDQHTDPYFQTSLMEVLHPSAAAQVSMVAAKTCVVPSDPLLPSDQGVSIWRPPRLA